MGKINTVIEVSASLDKRFFEFWLLFLRPLHNLTDKEITVAAAFLRERYELSQSITNSEVLDRVLFSSETKSKIRQVCGISSTHLQVILTKLKKNKVIVDNKFNPKLIPKIDNPNVYNLLLSFNLNV